MMLIIIATIKMFKYLQLTDTLSLFLTAIFSMASSFAVYMCLMTVLMVGFAVSGSLAFGSHIAAFRTMHSSLKTLFVFVCGVACVCWVSCVSHDESLTLRAQVSACGHGQRKNPPAIP